MKNMLEFKINTSNLPVSLIYYFFPYVLPDMGCMGGWSNKYFLIIFHNFCWESKNSTKTIISYLLLKNRERYLFQRWLEVCIQWEVLQLFPQIISLSTLKNIPWNLLWNRLIENNIHSVMYIIFDTRSNVLQSIPGTSVSLW